MQKQKDTLEAFKELLATKSLKLTYERTRIYEEVERLKGHFDADSLYERFKKRKERMSRGTIYRNLPLLLESGVIQKSAGEGKRDFYEKTAAKGHHDHMVCLGCKKIIEFHSDVLEELQESLSKEYKFKLVFHDHRLFGYCQNCQSKE